MNLTVIFLNVFFYLLILISEFYVKRGWKVSLKLSRDVVKGGSFANNPSLPIDIIVT